MLPAPSKESDEEDKSPLSLELIHLCITAINRDRMQGGVGDSVKIAVRVTAGSEVVDDKRRELV